MWWAHPWALQSSGPTLSSTDMRVSPGLCSLTRHALQPDGFFWLYVIFWLWGWYHMLAEDVQVCAWDACTG